MKLTPADSQLLDDLLAAPQQHWPRFVDRYAAVVFQVVEHCRHTQKWNLAPRDIEAIVVAVFERLAENELAAVRQFDRQGSFSTYLTVASRRIVLQELHDRDAEQRLQTALQDASVQRLQIPSTQPS